MTEERTDTTELPHGTFAEGEAEPDCYHDDERIGSFSDGEAKPQHDEEPGRFSEGMEQLGDDDPERHVEGRFSDESPR
jgi:hypothetical protein